MPTCPNTLSKRISRYPIVPICRRTKDPCARTLNAVNSGKAAWYFVPALLVFLFAFPVMSHAAKMLSQSQIKAELIGKRLTYSGAFSGAITYRRNGTLVSVSDKNVRVTGKWHFKGNKLCTKFDSKFRGGRTSCFTWTKIGPRTYRSSLGYTARR